MVADLSWLPDQRTEPSSKTKRRPSTDTSWLPDQPVEQSSTTGTKSWINPYGLPAFNDRPLTSKILPPWSPLQLGFTETGERIGTGMVNVAKGLEDLPTRAVNSLLGVNPTPLREGLEAGIRGALGPLAQRGVPSTLASFVTPHNIAVGLATGPAFDAITGLRAMNVPIQDVPRTLMGRNKPPLELYTKAIRPSVSGRSTASLAEKADARAMRAIEVIADRQSGLQFPDEAGTPTARLPESVNEMKQAVQKTKLALYKEYHGQAVAAGEAGARAPTESAAAAAEGVAANPIIQRYYPDLQKFATDWASRLRSAQSHGPEEMESLLTILNDDLATYYRNPQPGSGTRVVVEAGIANNLRRSLDQTIESAGGAQYQQLRNDYGALSSIEKDVNHRAAVWARQNAKGMVDFTDIFTVPQILHGITTMNAPATVLGGVGKLTAMYYKYLNNPDQMVKQLFQQVAKRGQPIETRGLIERGIATLGQRSASNTPRTARPLRK